MSAKASSLVAQAKRWAGHYGGFTTGEKAVVLTAVLRARAAWDDNDADAFAGVFVDNGSILVGDEQLNGREAIRAYFAEKFAGELRGTSVSEDAVDIRSIADGVAVAVTEGGIVPPGAQEIPAGGRTRATYVVVKDGSDWRLFSQQTSPIS